MNILRRDFFNRNAFFQKRSKYEPWYNDKSDYNTNAKSYYDYLARFNKLLKTMTNFINRLLNRDIEFIDTKSIDFTKLGDWIENGECEPDNYDDTIVVSANVIISMLTKQVSLGNVSPTPFLVKNGSVIENDGLWSPDYGNVLSGIDTSIGNIKGDINNLYAITDDIHNDITDIKNDITEIQTDISNLTNAIQKIVDNLYNSGAITNNNINNFNFNSGRNIATGNINLFGGVSDGSSFIRTNSGQTNNDISAGY